LVDCAGLAGDVSIRLRLDREGAQNRVTGRLSRHALIAAGFKATIPNQTAHAYVIE